MERRNGGRGAGVVEVWRERSGRGAIGSVGSLPPTPHLTSPLEGGRDEFFLEEWFGALGWLGSCLRRNDGGGAGMVGVARVPACAGMTDRGAGVTRWGAAWGMFRRAYATALRLSCGPALGLLVRRCASYPALR